jgi:hypothetical protein
LYSDELKALISSGETSESIKILECILSNLDKMFGESKNEYRKLIVYIGFPIHLSGRLLKLSLKSDNEIVLVKLVGKLLYDLSLGHREIKLLLGNERVIRGIIMIIRTQPIESIIEAFKTTKNLCQVVQTFEAMDNCDMVSILCSNLWRRTTSDCSVY